MHTNAVYASSWDIIGFLKSLGTYLITIGEALVVVVGAALLLYGLFHLYQKLTTSQPGGGPKWGMIAAQIIIGGALAFGTGWKLYTDVAKGGSTTITQMGNGGSGSVIDFATLHNIAFQVIHLF